MTEDEPPALAARPGSIPVTACVITFNEAAQITDCLATVDFCEALVVVDSHSADETRALAASAGATVIARDWPGHIAQKNFAIEQAATDWVLCLDADERVTPELRAAILALFAEGEPPAQGYEVSRRTFYLGRFIDHAGFYPDRKMRLFRRSKGRWGGVNPHDHVFLDEGCRAGRLTGDLHHFSYRDISDHLKTIDYFTTIAAREKLARRPSTLKIWLNLLFGPPWKFLKMYLLQRGILDGGAGLIVSLLGSYYVMLKYAKLWEAIHVTGIEAGDVSYGRKGDA